MEIERVKVIGFLSTSLAIDNVGIYPQAVVGGSHSYKKRTDKMEGHNECLFEIGKMNSNIYSFLEGLPEEVLKLLLEEKVYVAGSPTPSLYINCNDLFVWACADAEEILLEEIPGLQECLKLSPRFGELLWCARKRKTKPQKPYYEFFSEEEKVLFNEVGVCHEP